MFIYKYNSHFNLKKKQSFLVVTNYCVNNKQRKLVTTEFQIKRNYL